MTKFAYLGFIGHVFIFEISKNVLTIYSIVFFLFDFHVEPRLQVLTIYISAICTVSSDHNV